MQISFWYHMNGIGIGSLTLAMSEGNGSETKLWEKEGRQGPSWMQATVDLPTGTYVVSFIFIPLSISRLSVILLFK